MKTFKQFLENKQLNSLYNEAFELPLNTIQKIIQYYEENHKNYLKKPRAKIEPKLFPLDLTGTKYEFLQGLNPYVEVRLKGSIDNAAGVYTGIREEYRKTVGKIELSLKYFLEIDVVEHEILHFLQDLIKKHARKIRKPAKNNSKSPPKFPIEGGLPPLPIVKKIMKDKEINLSGKKNKKLTKHAHRPVEYYTNLNSLIRSLQYDWVALGIKKGKTATNSPQDSLPNTDSLSPTPDPAWNADYDDPRFIEKISNWVADKQKKQIYLKKLIDGNDPMVRHLEQIKNLNSDLYQIWLREIYKNFIDNEHFTADALEIKKITDSTKLRQQEKETLKQQQKQKLQQDDFAGGQFSIYAPDLDMYLKPEELTEDEIDSSLSFAEAMFEFIGLKVKENYNTGDDEVSFKVNSKKLTKIFNNIKAAKSTFSSTYEGQDLTQEKINNIFDYMAEVLAEDIANHLQRRGNYRNKEEILNRFYR